MNSKKHDFEKRKKEGAVQWHAFKKEYEGFVENMDTMKNPTLFLLCIIGTAMVVYFDAIVFRFLGLLIFAYGVYAFAIREGHRDGYFDHYSQNKEADTQETE